MDVVEFPHVGVEAPVDGAYISRVSLELMLKRYLLREAKLPIDEPLRVESLGCGLNGGIEGAIVKNIFPQATYIGYDNDTDEVCLAQDLLDNYLSPEEQRGISIQEKDICSFVASPDSIDVLLIRNPSPNGYVQKASVIEMWVRSVKPNRFILATYEIHDTGERTRRGLEVERMRSAFGYLIEKDVLRIIADEENPSPHPLSSYLRSDRGILFLQKVERDDKVHKIW